MTESDWRFEVLARSATWREKPLPSKRWFRVWRKAAWMRHLCSRMPELSTAEAGVAAFMASLGEPVARISASRGRGRVSAVSALVSSGSSSAPSAKSNLNGSSGRTSGAQLQLFPPSSGPSPAVVTKAPGSAFVQVTLERPTRGSGSSFWPTARASLNENRTTRNAPSHGAGHGKTLAGEACDFMRRLSGLSSTHGPKKWPTARATDGSKGGPNQRGRAGDLMLPSAAVTLMRRLAESRSESARPTPTASDDKASGYVSGDGIWRPALRLKALATMQRLWATCQARDEKSADTSPQTAGKNSRPLNEQAWHWARTHPDLMTSIFGPEFSGPPPSWPRLLLNPLFSAWLMGWDWLLARTCSDSSGTESFQNKQLPPSSSSPST
jgi:hypothetical protein